MKPGKKKQKKDKKTVNNNMCINCRKGCSMSGLCMRMWPEFIDPELKKKAKIKRKKETDDI